MYSTGRRYRNASWAPQAESLCTVGHRSHDPSFHKKYMEAGVVTFVVHCTVVWDLIFLETSLVYGSKFAVALTCLSCKP